MKYSPFSSSVYSLSVKRIACFLLVSGLFIMLYIPYFPFVYQTVNASAPTSVYLNGASTAIGTTQTTIGTLATSFPNSNNLIVAVVTFNLATTTTQYSIAANALILQDGSTTLASNANPIRLSGASNPREYSTYYFTYKDSGVTANPTYKVVATASATNLFATVQMTVYNNIAQSTYLNGTNTPVTTAELSLGTRTMSVAGDNIVIAAVQLYNTATSGSNSIAAGALKITKSGTLLTSNAYAIVLQGDSVSNLVSTSYLLIYRDANAAANTTYDVRISGVATGIDAQASILAFNGLDSAYTDAATTSIGTTNTIIGSALSTTLAAGNTTLIMGHEFNNSGSASTDTINAGSQQITGPASPPSNPYVINLGGSGTTILERTSGLIYQDTASANPTYTMVDKATVSPGIFGAGKLLALSLVAPTYTQATYRLFNNVNSTDVGTALAAQNTSATLTSAGEAFRIRMNINLANNQIGESAENFKLQYVDPGTGTCAAPSAGTPSSYTDVTGSTLIAYNTNAGATNGTALTANANDPTDSTQIINKQTYQSANNFTDSVSWIPKGNDGMWDFSLKDNTGGNSKSYCFRAVMSDGTAFATYTNYPKITAAPPGSLSMTTPSSATLNAVTLNASPVNGTGNLGTITVTDTRGTNVGWTLTATSSNFILSSHTISVTNLTLNPGTVTLVSGSLTGVSAGSSHTFTGTSDAATIMTASAGNGNGGYSVNPSLTLSVPVGSYAGSYNNTITETVQ